MLMMPGRARLDANDGGKGEPGLEPVRASLAFQPVPFLPIEVTNTEPTLRGPSASVFMPPQALDQLCKSPILSPTATLSSFLF